MSTQSKMTDKFDKETEPNFYYVEINLLWTQEAHHNKSVTDKSWNEFSYIRNRKEKNLGEFFEKENKKMKPK